MGFSRESPLQRIGKQTNWLDSWASGDGRLCGDGAQTRAGFSQGRGSARRSGEKGKNKNVVEILRVFLAL